MSVSTEPQSDTYVYIVVISEKQMQDNPNVNWESYSEVKEVFNLGESEHIELVK
jgi:predicted transcriptional regulator